MKSQPIFCAELQQLLQTGRAVGRSGKVFDELSALSTRNNLTTLYRAIEEFKPQRTLEIGLAYGGSCLVFLDGHRRLGHSPEARHVAIDPFQAESWDDTALMFAEKAGLDAYLDFRSQYSGLVLPRLLEDEQNFDLAYVDGSHLFEDVFVDFYFIARLLSPGGVVFFDDSSDAHVKKVLAFINANMSHCLEPHDISRFRDNGADLRYKAAKVLGKRQLTAYRKIGDAHRKWNSPMAKF